MVFLIKILDRIYYIAPETMKRLVNLKEAPIFYGV